MKMDKAIFWEAGFNGPVLTEIDDVKKFLEENDQFSIESTDDTSGIICLGDHSIFPVGFDRQRLADELLNNWFGLDSGEKYIEDKIYIWNNRYTGGSASEDDIGYGGQVGEPTIYPKEEFQKASLDLLNRALTYKHVEVPQKELTLEEKREKLSRLRKIIDTNKRFHLTPTQKVLRQFEELKKELGEND